MKKKLSIEEVREIIAEKYSPKNILQKWSPSVTYKEYLEIKSSDYKTKDQTKNLRIGVDKTRPIVILIISATFLFIFPFINYGNEKSGFLILLCCISFGLIVLSIYTIYFNSKIIFTTNSTSFTFKDQTIIWDDIVTTGIEIVHGGPSHQYLVLGLSNGEIVKLDVGKSDIGPTDLIRMIHLNRTVE
jgi:hypothetical protein